MDTLTCDVCKKVLTNPVTERTYWHFQTYDVCDECKDDMEWKLRPIVRAHYPFDVAWHQQLVSNCISDAVKQGHF